MPVIDVNLIGVPAFSLVVDAQGILRYDGFNAVGAAMTGLTSADWIGREPCERLPPEMAERVSACYRRCLSEGVTLEYEDEFEQPLGRLWWRTTLVPVLDAGRRIVGLVGFGVNITAQKHAEAELRDAAFRDPLTGVANRRGFERDLQRAIRRAETGSTAFTLLVADLDDFKAINDRYGHAAGDRVLGAVAERLRAFVGADADVARLGGDEFAAVVASDGCGSSALLDRAASFLLEPVAIGEMLLPVGVSLGAAEWHPGATGPSLLAEADARMYRRKKRDAA